MDRGAPSIRTKFNARITADCLAGGYLRVEVRQGETPLYVDGKRYLKTPGPVATQVEHDREGWVVRFVRLDHMCRPLVVARSR